MSETWERWVRKARSGDVEAWDKLYRHFSPRLQRTFRGELGGRLRRWDETEDIVQSAFAHALRNLDQLRDEASFEAWLRAIARRRILDRVRSRDRRRETPWPEGLELIIEGSSGSSSDVDAGLYEETLDAILSLFPDYPEHMALVYLRCIEGRDPEGLAIRFGLSRRTLFRRIETARHLVRSRLGGR